MHEALGLIRNHILGMAEHSCYPSTWEEEAGPSGGERIIMDYTASLGPAWATLRKRKVCLAIFTVTVNVLIWFMSVFLCMWCLKDLELRVLLFSGSVVFIFCT